MRMYSALWDYLLCKDCPAVSGIISGHTFVSLLENFAILRSELILKQ